MRLKGFVIALFGLFVVVTLFSLIMPSKVMTARTVTIQSSPQKIMQQLQVLQNWKNWHPLFKQEKTMVVSELSSGKSDYAEWIRNNKKNHLEINDVSPNAVMFILKRPGENDQMNKIALINFKDSSNIQVEWSALTKLKWYPWEKFSGMFIDKMTGPGYENALNELKTFLENRTD